MSSLEFNMLFYIKCLLKKKIIHPSQAANGTPGYKSWENWQAFGFKVGLQIGLPRLWLWRKHRKISQVFFFAIAEFHCVLLICVYRWGSISVPKQFVLCTLNMTNSCVLCTRSRQCCQSPSNHLRCRVLGFMKYQSQTITLQIFEDLRQ